MKNYTKAKKKPISKKVNKIADDLEKSTARTKRTGLSSSTKGTKDLLTKPKPKREQKREGISFTDALGRSLDFHNLYSGPGSK
tara:strand:- start:400 stop:648 length:249 start_codon:yes stop_codon:yes gene_type:complete